MKAAVLEELKKPLVVREVQDPELAPDGAIIRVEANGVCRSDWHAWVGDWDWIGIQLPLPHVLGHEFTGVVEEVGRDVKHFRKGDRVIVPFSQGDGTCAQCKSGHQNICDHIVMPGFSYWGGFGRYVHIPNADVNLVNLPDGVGLVEAAGMGCRFMTAFHGVVDQAKVRPGEWVAVHGCGGVGLSAVQIATAMGANVIAVDIGDDKLEFARKLGAVATVNAQKEVAPEAIKEITKGGAHVSIDALGVAATCQSSLLGLRKRGRHLQIGLTTREAQGMIALPIDLIVLFELEIVGSLGMQASRYPEMLQMVEKGKLRPGDLVTNTISLEEVSDILASMTEYGNVGVTVVDKW
ncbi:zinc-dependent alcohol dehydrogenase family protein [Effusibacillus lacus]|uniref:Alcohol dehydrogenase n=1 Tax=Effusibacillus lacus TaxID=1348429 RepID=A0A292YLU2_9BACL|nr:zinc-dependent alcohol dehydrogenase family protein [Effusibacillus lacus]TCS71631.1 alcohol dehydrogenase/propanol-preferring alcohol dehydrogenase [Effusibacillus lacus]GAX90136.1 alcohol dehydrogenase [Effusibacillus lacus]